MQNYHLKIVAPVQGRIPISSWTITDFPSIRMKKKCCKKYKEGKRCKDCPKKKK